MPNLFHIYQAMPIRVRINSAANVLITAMAGQSLGIVHVIEYPKCGGSWIRNMTQHYLEGRPYLDGRIVGWRSVVQLHTLYAKRYCRPIVVVRDPRDMFVSFYYFETTYEARRKHLAVNRYFEHDPGRDVKDDFAAYLEAKLIHRTFPPFSYRAFLASWLNRLEVCVIRYEDVLADTVAALRRIVEFVGAPVDEGRLIEVAEHYSFTNETRRNDGAERQPGDARPDKFLRKGIVGDWQNHFSEASCRLLEEHEGTTLRRLGYERNATWINAFLRKFPS